MFENQTQAYDPRKAQIAAHMGNEPFPATPSRDPDLVVAMRRLQTLNQQALELVKLTDDRTGALRRPGPGQVDPIGGGGVTQKDEPRAPLANEILFLVSSTAEALSRIRELIGSLEA